MDEAENTGTVTGTGVAPPPSEAAPPNSNVAARDSWLKTAGGGDAQPEAKSDAPETQPNLSAQPIAEQPTQQVPVPVTSMKRGGLLGVVDSIADVLAGKTRPELGKDPDGNLYVKQHTMSRGEQWMRIAGEAVHGAAAGMAAGRGAGNQGKAGLAGWQAGEEDQDKQKQNAQDMQGQVDRDQMQKANNQMLQMKTAEFAWNQAREKVKASQDDIKFNDEQVKQLTDAGGKVIGVAAHPGDIGDILKVQPDVMKHLVEKGTIQIKKNLDEDGNVIGIKAILMPDEWGKTLLPPGTQGSTFNPVSGQIEHFNYSDPVTQGEKAVHDASAVTAKDEFDAKKRKAQKEAADLANTQSETNARNQELPGKIAETKAGTAQKYAEAGRATAEGAAATAKTADTDDPALVSMIGTGQMPVGRLSYLLARNPALAGAVAKAYPGFDGSKVEGYTKTYADFTSGHTSQELLSGGTALQHMAELRAMNTADSHLPWTPAYNAYQSKANQVAVELAKFYGNSTIEGIRSYHDTLMAQLPGKRDAAITTQAQSMADRLDNYATKWANAAPSEAYEAKMPGISPEAQAAWKTLDPKYASRTVARIFAGQAQQQPQSKGAQQGEPVQLQPGEVPHVNPQTQQQIVVRNGKWVDVKTGNPVTQ
jgi:hypothetical protein